jgi:transposase
MAERSRANGAAGLDELRRRRQAVRWYLRGMRFTDICARLDRCSTWLSKWLKRYQEHGWEGLRDRSRRPHRLRAQTPDTIINEIIALRRFLEAFQEGHTDRGAKAIRRILLNRHVQVPSLSTIERILRRHEDHAHKRRVSRPLGRASTRSIEGNDSMY